MAAFTSKDSNDETAYLEKYTKLFADPTITMRTIKVNNEIASSITEFVVNNDAKITYWLDRRFWGQGIATKALNDFLTIEKIRPIYGRVAFDNYSLRKVLEHCGFVGIGKEKGFAHA